MEKSATKNEDGFEENKNKENNTDGLITTIQTSESGDVIVRKLKKSEMREMVIRGEGEVGREVNEAEVAKRRLDVADGTLILHPRNSLDPNSSLQRDIDDYLKVMERQEQLLAQSRRNSADPDAVNQIRNHINAEQVIPEEDAEQDPNVRKIINSENNKKFSK